jgi:hypothetical protein
VRKNGVRLFPISGQGRTHIVKAKRPMKSFTRKPFSKHKFDFEIGYLVKSPCRGCEKRGLLPKCSENCDILDRIQTILIDSICCSRSR